MKNLIKVLVAFLLLIPMMADAQTQVTFNLSYDIPSETYTVSMNSNTTHNSPLSRISSTTQVTIVVPQISGGWQVTNLTALTALGWGFTLHDGTLQGLSQDYLFFAPTNAGTYSPFTITANANIPLFSFKSGSGCVGNLSLYDNISDPLNAHPSVNGDNNIAILGAGSGNKYVGNTSGSVACSLPCTANAGVLSY